MNVDANIWTRDNSCSYPNFPIVDVLIDNMTIEQKVGQIIQPDLGSITLKEIQENQLGFVLNGGDTAPYNNKYATVDDWKRRKKSMMHRRLLAESKCQSYGVLMQYMAIIM